MARNFELEFFQYLSQLIRYMRAQPLNLGGLTSYSGGGGGPPGGFVGQLPQSRVTYDLSEAENLDVPENYSGASLVNNLNHIRYRISQIEDITNPGLIIYDDSVLVASGVTVLNFNNADVEFVDPNRVNITFSTLTVDKLVPSGVFNMDLSNQIGASQTTFNLAEEIIPSTLRLYYNGIRQRDDFFTVDPDAQGFVTTFTAYSGDSIFVDYDILINDTAYVASGITQAYLEEFYYDKIDIDGFLTNKADVDHTHLEEDITDMYHNAIAIRGIPVASGVPLDEQALVYDDGANMYIPTSISTSVKTIYQQFILTIEGVMSDAGTGIKPLRLYAHTIGGIGTATIEEIRCALNTAPVTTDVRVDILKNGTSIFDPPEYIDIAVGQFTADRNTNFSSGTFVKNDYFQIELVQTDGTASDLSVHIRFSWETD